MLKLIKIHNDIVIYTQNNRIIQRRLTKDAQMVLSYYNRIPANFDL